ncbi:MAG: hypothetical protein RI918_707, partial [Pseudomonadota bacterium]
EPRVDVEGNQIATNNIATQADNTPADGNIDTQNKAPRQGGRPPRGERTERPEREGQRDGPRRERGERSERGAGRNAEVAGVAAAGLVTAVAAEQVGSQADSQVVTEVQGMPQDATPEGQRNERRSRDRYGRDRRERNGDRPDRSERPAEQSAESASNDGASQAAPVQAEFSNSVQDAAPVKAIATAEPAVAATRPVTPAPVAASAVATATHTHYLFQIWCKWLPRLVCNGWVLTRRKLQQLKRLLPQSWPMPLRMCRVSVRQPWWSNLPTWYWWKPSAICVPCSCLLKHQALHK